MMYLALVLLGVAGCVGSYNLGYFNGGKDVLEQMRLRARDATIRNVWGR